MSELTGTYEDEIEASLKPCPRCNGKALIENFDEILCDSCGLWSGDDWPSLDEAVEWWNKQPHIEALNQRIAELEAQLVRKYLDTLPAAPAPDWSSAPEWATHHVYNCVGSGLWINGEAKVDTTWASGWRRVLRQTMDGHTDYSGCQLPIGIDWREALVARPTE